MASEQIVEPEGVCRYGRPRQLINWYKNDHLKILKMLAWVVHDREGIRNPEELTARVGALCEAVTRRILGEGVSFLAICERTLAEQNREVTASKLYHRAVKTECYLEFNDMKDAVVDAYKQIRGIERAA